MEAYLLSKNLNMERDSLLLHVAQIRRFILDYGWKHKYHLPCLAVLNRLWKDDTGAVLEACEYKILETFMLITQYYLCR